MHITVENYTRDKHYPRIVRATERILERSLYVAPVDLFVEMGWLTPENLARWTRGQIPFLEKVLAGSLSKHNRVLRILRMHCHDLEMNPSVTVYRHKSHRLRFSKSREPKLEESFRRHFVIIGSPEKFRAKLGERTEELLRTVTETSSGRAELPPGRAR